MRASGIGPWAVVRPLLWMGALMSVAVLGVNESVAPQAALVTDSFKETYLERPADPKKPHRVIKTIEHLAAYGLGHTLLYAKSFDPTEKKLEGIVILQHGPNLRLQRKITAQSAVWTGESWRFLNGTILQFNLQGQAVGRPVPFETKILPVDRPEILAKSDSQAAFMNTRDLARYLERLRGAGSATLRKLKVDLYAKPASAFACLVLVLIGIPFAIQPVRGAGAVLGLSLGLGVGLVFYAANAILIALGKGGWFPPLIAAWAAPFLFATYGIRQTWRRLA